jgi:hypothetical protein
LDLLEAFAGVTLVLEPAAALAALGFGVVVVIEEGVAVLASVVILVVVVAAISVAMVVAAMGVAG